MNDVNYVDFFDEKADNFLEEKQDSIIAAVNHFGPIRIADTPPARTSLTALKAAQGNASESLSALLRLPSSSDQRSITSALRVRELSRERHAEVLPPRLRPFGIRVS